jgi:AcrR family transcriptional regulator
MTKHSPDDVRARIVRAAVALILEDGVAAYSLDRVIARARVSKGGLLHHFRTKDDLSVALMQYCFAQFEQRIARCAAADKGPVHGRQLRAYINATFQLVPDEDALVRALFAISASAPHLLERRSEAISALTPARTADGLPSERAEMLRLACDGLWVNEMMGWASYTRAQRNRLHKAMLAQATPAAEAR